MVALKGQALTTPAGISAVRGFSPVHNARVSRENLLRSGCLIHKTERTARLRVSKKQGEPLQLSANYLLIHEHSEPSIL